MKNVKNGLAAYLHQIALHRCSREISPEWPEDCLCDSLTLIVKGGETIFCITLGLVTGNLLETILRDRIVDHLEENELSTASFAGSPA